uniref:NADH:ubiquinone reductase (H(+)-translocating) n=1 Tax=Ceraphronidae sp. ZJUH_2016007 TaxID=2491153 RepID=A0A3Q8U9W8_9HYME|nr:NADH dehydrogenase subunit 5 [Ceraphronidae sp. ZJUH_2016007]
MKVYLFIVYMFLVCLFFIFQSLFFMLSNMIYLVNWTFFFVYGVNLSMIIYIDWISLMFLGVVMFISSFVMFYSVEYMGSNKFINLYMYLVLMFVMSMGLVILSPNLLSILLGWDGLGLISYCLVSYYQNFFSYKSAMLTLLMNRLGDLTLIMAICLMWGLEGWLFIFFNNSFVVGFMLMISGLAKSAQIPLSIWLPAAMAAPTPISALVHSSTLVTAGVYLYLRFLMIYSINFINCMLHIITFSTILMSSMVALFIYDLKKIIAMSTLSQLGLMMYFYSLGLLDVVFFHLLTHALFKSMMFMCAGVIIHYSGDNQDIRLLGGLGLMNLPYTLNSLIISSLALSGLPFLAGFYSKDFMLELMLMKGGGLYMYLGSVLLLIFTVMYSLRICFYLICSSSGISYIYCKSETFIMSGNLMMLTLMSLFSGFLLLDLLFLTEGIFLIEVDMIFLLMMLFIGFIGYFFFIKFITFFSMYWFIFVNLMWGMNLMLSCFNGFFYLLMSFYMLYLDKGWMELLILGMVKNFIEMISNLLSFYYNYFYMLIFLGMMVMMI